VVAVSGSVQAAGDALSVHWKAAPHIETLPKVSIIVEDRTGRAKKCASLLKDALPVGFRGEIIPVNPALAAKAVKRDADMVVLVPDNVARLSEWLSPFLATLRDFPSTGAAVGKLIQSDGGLQEAGAIVFSDASIAAFGSGEQGVDQPLF